MSVFLYYKQFYSIAAGAPCMKVRIAICSRACF